jgi:selenoprotein W-related protein
MTDQLLQEFQFDVDSWTLIPSDGGRYEVEVNGKLVYSKLQTKRHAELEEIRDLLRRELTALKSA